MMAAASALVPATAGTSCRASSQRAVRAQAQPKAGTSGKGAGEAKVVVGVDPSRPPAPGLTLNGGATAALVVVQSLALVGAVVGGLRARTLRLQLQRVNEQLRSINAALRNQIESDLVPEADEAEAFKAYRHALENAMASASAAHPLETFGGEEGFSLASARREISRAIKESRDWTKEGRPDEGVMALVRAEELAIELKDPVAERGVVRAMSTCYRAQGKLSDAIQCLERGLNISSTIGGTYVGDADMYGEIGDLYVELGDYVKAQEYYDRCIKALESDNILPTSSWDC